MPEIIMPDRAARPAGSGLSYLLGTKILGVPLAMRSDAADRLRRAIETNAFDASVDVSVAGISASKFAGTLDAKNRFRVTDDGYAIVPVSGVLIDRGAWLGDLGGWATSYEGLCEQMQRIRKDDAIKGVVLDIDSPGGMVAGLFDLTNEIAALRRKKRVVALAQNLAASAAYAIACAADELFVTRTGEAGSIGVIAYHQSYQRALDAAGVDTTIIYEGQHKPDGNPFQQLGHGARAEMAQGVAEAYDLFVKHVAKERSLDEAAVRATEARMFVGEKAVSTGLADGVKSFEELLEHIRNGKAKTTKPRGSSNPKQGGRNVSENSPAARTDLEAVITATVAAMKATGAVSAPAAPAAAAAQPAAAAAPAAPAQPSAADEQARIFAILECDEAKERPAMARELAKTKLSLDEAKKILAAAAPEKKADAENPLAAAMKKSGTSAGVRPDAAAGANGGDQRPSLSDSFAKRHNARVGKRS